VLHKLMFIKQREEREGGGERGGRRE